MAARFAAALSFDQFVAGDTARQAEWRRNYDHASSVVTEAVSRWGAPVGRWHLLVVAESWCGDAVNSVPYLARLAAEHPAVDLRLIRRADGQDLLDAHPLDGQPAAPLVLVLDESFAQRAVWIENPAALRTLVKSKQGRTCEDALKVEVASWRTKDGGRSVLSEVLSLMAPATSADTHADHKPLTPES
ncbi:MAG: thioredoxin family protein [Gemmatimonadetes bacterium]|nr:thioredoxin family protein [Gemmatimonadota bacterium]